MENVQNEGEQDPKEKLAEEEALKPVVDDDIRSQIVEKYGLSEDENSEIIDKIVEDRKEEQKKLSTAIRQKRDWRAKAQTPKEKTEEVKPQTSVQKETPVGDIDKIVEEKLNERDLASMDLSDELKSKVRAYAKAEGMSYRNAVKSDYFEFVKGKEDEKAQSEEASASFKGKSMKAKRDFGNLSDDDIKNLSEEDYKTYKDWLKAQG